MVAPISRQTTGFNHRYPHLWSCRINPRCRCCGPVLHKLQDHVSSSPTLVSVSQSFEICMKHLIRHFLISLQYQMFTTLHYRFTFPGIFIFYQMLSSLVYIAIFLLNYVDFKRLMCDSRSLVVSLMPGNETPFCIISGNIIHTVRKILMLPRHLVCLNPLYGVEISLSSCIVYLHQPPGGPLVDIPPLHDLLCRVLPIQVPILEKLWLPQVHTHSDGHCSPNAPHRISRRVPQSGWLCPLHLHSAHVCG